MLDEELQAIIASLATKEDIRADASGCADTWTAFSAACAVRSSSLSSILNAH